MKQEEKENKPKYLQLCPEWIVEPMCRSPSPSGLCLAFGEKKKKGERNRPLQTSSFLKGKIYFINWPTPESNWLFFRWLGGRSRPQGSAGRRAGFSHCCCSCTASVCPSLTPSDRQTVSGSVVRTWDAVAHRCLGCWLCPYPHGPTKETTPEGQSAPLSAGETEAWGADTGVEGGRYPTSSSWGVCCRVGDAQLTLQLEGAGRGEVDPKEPPSRISGGFPLLAMCFPLLQGLGGEFCFPHRHINRSSCISITGIVRVKTSRERAGGDVCTCQDE